MSDYPPSFHPDEPTRRDPDDLPDDGFFMPEPDASAAPSTPAAPPPAAPPAAPPVAVPAAVPAPVDRQSVDERQEPPQEPRAAHAAAPVKPVAAPAPVDAPETPAAPSTTRQHAAEPVEQKAPGKRGPKFITDEPTTRVEGQLYVPQFEAGMGILARLKAENKKTAGRRRMTINTLIRIGMAVIIEHRDELHGASEQELLDSLYAALHKPQNGEPA